MSRKAYRRRLIVRAIEDSLVILGLWIGAWLLGAVASIALGLLGVG